MRTPFSGSPSRVLLALLSVVALLAGCGSDKLEPATTAASHASTLAKPIPTSLDGIALAAPDAAAVSVASAPNAWGGARTGSEPTLSDRVVNYDIKVTLDPVKHTLQGQEKLSWRNRSAVPVRSVYLHLYMNAFEGHGSTLFQEKISRGFRFRSDVPSEDGGWGHIELKNVAQGGAKVPWLFVHPDGGPETDHTVVRMDLPEAVAPGASTTLDIDFHTQLPRVVARTGYFGTFHLIGQWFPKIAVLELPGERGATAPRWNAHEFHVFSEFYADYGNYDVKITAPKDYIVGATGALQSTPTEKDGLATHHYVQGDVHDFAWTADNRTAKPLEGVYTGEGNTSVKVKVLYPPEYQSNAAPVLKTTLDSLAYFSKNVGAYPYQNVTVVIPPHNAGEAGGMEYPTFFTADNVANLQPDTIGAAKLDYVTIHEVGHDWFYGILGSNEFEEPMLDETLNTYWDTRMFRARGQQLNAVPMFLRKLGVNFKISAFEFQRITGFIQDPEDALGNNSWERHSFFGYASLYGHGATTLRDLEEKIGHETMEKAFKEYFKRWKYRHPSIADFRDVLSEVSGKRELVETVFAQQVYATKRVDDRVEKFTCEEVLPQAGTQQSNGVWVEETEEQVGKRIKEARKTFEKTQPNPQAKDAGPFSYRTTVMLRRRGAAVPQTLVVKFADGSVETVQWNNSNNWERFSWVKPVKAVSAELDPERQHYLDLSKLDDSLTIQADASASRRWGSQLAALIELLFSLIASV